MKTMSHAVLWIIERIALISFVICFLAVGSPLYLIIYREMSNTLPFAVPIGNTGFCVTSSGNVFVDSGMLWSYVMFAKDGKSAITYLDGGSPPNTSFVSTDNGHIVIGSSDRCAIFDEKAGKTIRVFKINKDEALIYTFSREFEVIKIKDISAIFSNGMYTRRICSPGSIVFTRPDINYSEGTNDFYYNGSTYHYNQFRQNIVAETLDGSIVFMPNYLSSCLSYPYMYFITVLIVLTVYIMTRSLRLFFIKHNIIKQGKILKLIDDAEQKFFSNLTKILYTPLTKEKRF